MVEIGSVIPATVTRVEAYGIFLTYDSETVFVHLPEVSWVNKGPMLASVRLGEVLKVVVLRYNYSTQEIVGSLRRLHPEQNPYRLLSRLEPGQILCGCVKYIHAHHIAVDLPNGAWGEIRPDSKTIGLKVGDRVAVKIASIEVDEGLLQFDFVGQKTETPNGAADTMAPSPLLQESL